MPAVSNPRVLLLAAGALLGACAPYSPAQLSSFEAALAARDSATLALEDWCAANRLAPDPRISAAPVLGAPARAPAMLADILALSAGTQPGYRHVRLSCGGVVLSEAHNWYVPSRLTADMNAALATGSVPFGKVVAATGFMREMLGSVRGRALSCPVGTVLSNRALLRLPDGAPLALVVECYTKANFRKSP